jgi:hypothetical protein
MSLNFVCLFCVPALLLTSCSQAQQDRSTQSAGPAATKLVLHGYDIVLMKLSRPATVAVPPDKPRQYSSVYVVRLKLDRPATMGPALDIYIGDYRVTEFGGLPDGIYFKVYDLDQLRKLAGGEMKCRQAGRPVQSLGQRFEVPEVSKIPVVSESEVFTNRK